MKKGIKEFKKAIVEYEKRFFIKGKCFGKIFYLNEILKECKTPVFFSSYERAIDIKNSYCSIQFMLKKLPCFEKRIKIYSIEKPKSEWKKI